jgi:hypothetical protein
MHPISNEGITPKKPGESTPTHETRTSPVIEKTDQVGLGSLPVEESKTQPPQLQGGSRPTITVVTDDDDDDDIDVMSPLPLETTDSEIDSLENDIEIEPAATSRPKSYTLDEVGVKLDKFNSQLDSLDTEIDKIHEATVAKAKELHDQKKIHRPIISHLPKEELVKFELDLRLKGERFQTRLDKLNGMIQGINNANLPPEEQQAIQDKITALETKFKAVHKKLEDQLNFHSMSKLARLMQKIAEILHRLNEEMREVLNIRG